MGSDGDSKSRCRRLDRSRLCPVRFAGTASHPALRRAWCVWRGIVDQALPEWRHGASCPGGEMGRLVVKDAPWRH